MYLKKQASVSSCECSFTINLFNYNKSERVWHNVDPYHTSVFAEGVILIRQMQVDSLLLFI